MIYIQSTPINFFVFKRNIYNMRTTGNLSLPVYNTITCGKNSIRLNKLAGNVTPQNIWTEYVREISI